MTRVFASLLAIGFLGAQVLAGHYFSPHDDRAVELKAIPSLIFRKGAMTTGRRTSPVAQLSCTGGSACGTQYEPDVVHCTNIGIDYATGDPTWKCTAELENGLRLGVTDVVCEGFRDRDDPWILRGSCGLEYTMQGSPVRNQGQSGSYYSGGDAYRTYKSYSSYSPLSSSRSNWVNWLVGFFILWLFLKFLNRTSAATTTGIGGTGGGGGFGRFFGGGGGGGNGYFGGGGGGPYYAGGYDANCAPGVQPNGGPGFWSGLFGGAGLGYLFGRNNGNRPYAAGWNQDYGYAQPRAWTGGGATYAAAPPAAGPATQTATGYGTTRRRG